MPKSFRSLGVMPLIAVLALGWSDASAFAEIDLILHDEDGTVYVAEIVYLEAVDLDPGDPWVNIEWYSRSCGGAWNHHTDIDNMNCVAAWSNGAYSGDFKCRVFHESGAIS